MFAKLLFEKKSSIINTNIGLRSRWWSCRCSPAGVSAAVPEESEEEERRAALRLTLQQAHSPAQQPSNG
jgi:hypothetical protein